MYRYWFFLSVINAVAVAQEDEYYVFTDDKNVLSECIENYLNNCNDPYYRNLGIAKDIADLAATRFSGSTRKKSDFRKTANKFFYFLRDRKSFLFENQQIHEPLRIEIKMALISCVGDTLLPIPIFEEEPYEMRVLLDYILVDWQNLLIDMIRPRNGRTLLRRYAEPALASLACALDLVNDHEYFRYLIRYYWTRRAQNYFDGRDTRVPYLRHWYTMRHPFPHTYDDSTVLFARSANPLSYRNPQATQENFQRIMSIHVSDGDDEDDIFSVYQRDGVMRSSDYYIEAHLDQFYRIIFVYLEMHIHGIASEEEDVYLSYLLVNLLPNQRILYSDSAYRNYLLSLKKQLKRTMSNNVQLQIDFGHSLLTGSIREEDLISLLSIQIQQNNLNKRIDGNLTTSSPVSTTTSNYDQKKRKGSVWVNEKGKNFCKRPRTADSQEPQQQQRQQHQQQRTQTNSDCFDVKNGNFNQICLPVDETAIMTDTLRSMIMKSLNHMFLNKM